MRLKVLHRTVKGYRNAWLVTDEQTERYFIISQIQHSRTGLETLVFPAEEDGIPINHTSLAGGPGFTHETAIEEMETRLDFTADERAIALLEDIKRQGGIAALQLDIENSAKTAAQKIVASMLRPMSAVLSSFFDDPITVEEDSGLDWDDIPGANPECFSCGHRDEASGDCMVGGCEKVGKGK